MIDASIACPYCESNAIRNQGLTSSGTQRYHCRKCKTSFTFKSVGRKSMGYRPLTNYERVKRHRIKKQQLAQTEREKANKSLDSMSKFHIDRYCLFYFARLYLHAEIGILPIAASFTSII